MYQLPHLVAIPSHPLDLNNPLAIMWWMPQKGDFVREETILNGIYKLCYDNFSQLQHCCQELLSRAASPQFKSASPLIPVFTNLIMEYLNHLEFITTSLQMSQLVVHETQRYFLELTALLDYIEVYEPRMNGTLVPNESVKVAKTMGAYTFDLTKCECLFRARLPVWLIRPYTDLHSARIDCIVYVKLAADLLPISAAIAPMHPTIFRGPSTDFKKYEAMGRYSMGFQRYPDPFRPALVEEHSEPSTVRPSCSALDCAAHSKHYSPCKFISIFVLKPKFIYMTRCQSTKGLLKGISRP